MCITRFQAGDAFDPLLDNLADRPHRNVGKQSVIRYIRQARARHDRAATRGYGARCLSFAFPGRRIIQTEDEFDFETDKPAVIKAVDNPGEKGLI